jgi:hypothetical protein
MFVRQKYAIMAKDSPNLNKERVEGLVEESNKGSQMRTKN